MHRMLQEEMEIDTPPAEQGLDGGTVLLRTTVCGSQGVEMAIGGKFYHPNRVCVALAKTDLTIDLWEKVPEDGSDDTRQGFEGWLNSDEENEEDEAEGGGGDSNNFAMPRLRLVSRSRMASPVLSLHCVKRSSGALGEPACDWLLVVLKELRWVLLGDMGEEIGSGEFLQPDDAPIRRERLLVSCVVSEGVCHVLGALYKGVLNHMSFDVRRTQGGEGVGGEQELVWMEWERPGCVDGIVSAAAAYKEYEITQLAMAEVDRQGRQGSGWMVAVVHASKPGTVSFPAYPPSVDVRLCVLVPTASRHPALTDDGQWIIRDAPPSCLLRPCARRFRLMVLSSKAIKTFSSTGQASVIPLPGLPQDDAGHAPDSAGQPPAQGGPPGVKQRAYYQGGMDVCTWWANGIEEGVGLAADGRVFRFEIHDYVLQNVGSLVKVGRHPLLTWVCPLDHDGEQRSAFLVGSRYGRCQVMVVRGDRARLRPCKGLLNGILPVEGAVQVNLRRPPAGRIMGPDFLPGRATVDGPTSTSDSDDPCAAYPTVAVASGTGKAGRISLLQRALGMEIMGEGDVGFSGGDSVGTFDLLSTGAASLGGELLVLTSSAASCSYAMLATPEGGAEPIELAGLEQGARTVALGTAPSGEILQVTVAGVRVLSPDGKKVLDTKTPADIIGNWAHVWVPATSPLDHALLLDGVLVVTIQTSIAFLALDPSSKTLSMDKHRLPDGSGRGCISGAVAGYALPEESVVVALSSSGTTRVAFLQVKPPGGGHPMEVEQEVKATLLPSREGDIRSLLFYSPPTSASTSEPPLLLAGLADGQLLVVHVSPTFDIEVKHSLQVGRCLPRLVPIPSLSCLLVNSSDADWLLTFPHPAMAPTIQPIHTPLARRTPVALSPLLTNPATPDEADKTGPRPLLAWLNPQSQLCFGTVADCLTGRLTSRPLHQTPRQLLYVPSLQAVVVVTEAPGDPPTGVIRCFQVHSTGTDPFMECSASLPLADGHVSCAVSLAPSQPSSPPRSVTIAVSMYNYADAPANPDSLSTPPPFSALVLVRLTPTAPPSGHVATAHSSPRMEFKPLVALSLPVPAFFLAHSRLSDALLVSGDGSLTAWRWGETEEGQDPYLKQKGETTYTPQRGAITALTLSQGEKGAEVVVLSDMSGGVFAYAVGSDASLRLLSISTQALAVGLLTPLEWQGKPAVVAFNQLRKEFLLFSWAASPSPEPEDEDAMQVVQEEEGAGKPAEAMTLATWPGYETMASIVALGKGAFLAVGTSGSVAQYRPFDRTCARTGTVPSTDRGPHTMFTALLKPTASGGTSLEEVPVDLSQPITAFSLVN